MQTTVKKRKKKATPTGVGVFKKMLEDKKAIGEHLKKGGTFAELKKKGYRFATV